VNDGDDYWIVTAEFEQFDKKNDFFYLISDETGQLLQTMN
jgi:hypothetical protein